MRLNPIPSHRTRMQDIVPMFLRQLHLHLHLHPHLPPSTPPAPPAPPSPSDLLDLRANCIERLAHVHCMESLCATLRCTIDPLGFIFLLDQPTEAIGRIRITFEGRTLCATCKCQAHSAKCKVLVQCEGRYYEVKAALARWIVSALPGQEGRHAEQAEQLRLAFRKGNSSSSA